MRILVVVARTANDWSFYIVENINKNVRGCVCVSVCVSDWRIFEEFMFARSNAKLIMRSARRIEMRDLLEIYKTTEQVGDALVSYKSLSGCTLRPPSNCCVIARAAVGWQNVFDCCCW